MVVKKKRKQSNPGQVVIPTNHPNLPETHEIDAAFALARHYRCVVEFLIPVDDYKRKTADIIMFGVEWEIKCPVGNSKYTIQEQFRRASKQARNIIIDTRRTKLNDELVENSILVELRKRPNINKVILINKFEKVMSITFENVTPK